MLGKYVLRGRGVFFFVIVLNIFLNCFLFHLLQGRGYFQALLNMTTVKKQNYRSHLGLWVFRKRSVAMIVCLYSCSPLVIVQTLLAEVSGCIPWGHASSQSRTGLFCEGVTQLHKVPVL